MGSAGRGSLGLSSGGTLGRRMDQVQSKMTLKQLQMICIVARMFGALTKPIGTVSGRVQFGLKR